MSFGPLSSQSLNVAREVIPGGCVGATRLPDDMPVVIGKAAGAYITDIDGREYIDYVMGSGPLVLGHAYPEVVDAVMGQAPLGSAYYALCRQTVDLAQAIVGAVPCGEGVRFQTTGSEATWAAVRIARTATKRTKVLRFEGGLHGGNDLGLTSQTPKEFREYPEPLPDCDGISPGFLSEILVAPYNELNVTEEIVAGHWRDLAAIIIEPMQRFIEPVPGFLEGLRRLTERYGIVLIFDEVVTGFRHAWGGAQELYSVTPDLATYGKVIGGGYPLSAVVGKWELVALADPYARRTGPYAFMSGTLTANPVSCAAGRATLDVLHRERPYFALNQAGAKLAEGLRAAARGTGADVNVMQVGSVVQVLFDAPLVIRNYRDVAKADAERGVRFGYELIRRGVHVVPGGKLYVATVHGEEEISVTIEKAAEAFRACA